jgi:hypothetical protein
MKLSLPVKVGLGLVGFAIFLGIVTSMFLKATTFGTVNNISDRYYTDALGTDAAPVTLSELYASSTSERIKIPGLSNVVLAGTYTPAGAGNYLFLQIERSVDYGATWKPYQTIAPAATKTDVYTMDFATSSEGAPFQIPGGTSATVSGTAMTFSFDNTLAADYIRVSAKESLADGSYGTLHLQVLTTNH